MTILAGDLAARSAAPRPVRQDEGGLIAQLRAGDDVAFAALIAAHNAPMIRLARFYVRDLAAAEDVVQETWLAVFKGIDRFDERSSLKTWVYRILTNRAKTAGQRQSRTTPTGTVDESDATADRRGTAASPWPAEFDDVVLAQELMNVVIRAIATLAGLQRAVVTLRDVECRTSKEVCVMLDLTEANQRVLLHRGRSVVRQHIEIYAATG